jgi:PAS domain S-box-containing protein
MIQARPPRINAHSVAQNAPPYPSIGTPTIGCIGVHTGPSCASDDGLSGAPSVRKGSALSPVTERYSSRPAPRLSGGSQASSTRRSRTRSPGIIGVLLGHPCPGPLEALGSSLDLIIPVRQRTRHWDGYRRVMSTGTTKYGSDLLRVPSLRSDGQRRSIAFTVTLLKDADGTVTGIAAVVRDETERWNQEQELRRLAQASPDVSNAASSAASRAQPA